MVEGNEYLILRATTEEERPRGFLLVPGELALGTIRYFPRNEEFRLLPNCRFYEDRRSWLRQSGDALSEGRYVVVGKGIIGEELMLEVKAHAHDWGALEKLIGELTLRCRACAESPSRLPRSPGCR